MDEPGVVDDDIDFIQPFYYTYHMTEEQPSVDFTTGAKTTFRGFVALKSKRFDLAGLVCQNAKRRGTDLKENQRVRLSKKILRESLVRLLSNKSIHKISVREICDDAEINRTTFYKYYGSQYDLLRDMENEMLAQIDSYLSLDKDQSGNDIKLLAQIVAYLHENLDLCRLLVNNTVDSVFPEKLLNLPMIRQLLGEQLAEEYDSEELDYVYQFVVNGGFNIIKRWINKEHREPPEKIAGILVNTVYKLFPRVKSPI